MNSKILIIAAIALLAVVLGGIILHQDAPLVEEEIEAMAIPLKSADFKYFEIKTPEDSNFTIKNSLNETTKGMVYWKNSGNFSSEVQGIIIDKNLTDLLIHQNMELISNTTDTKVYEAGGIYQVVKTVNDTDIIITGSNLEVINEMMGSVKIKDTKNITSPKPVTPVEKAVDKNKEVKNVEKTKEVKKEVKNVETKKEVKQEKKSTPTDNGRKKTQGQIYVGGGIIHTGSELNDKTNAKIYIDGGNPGESVIVKIKYYRDGNSLNNGNMVTATIHDDGYININSADAYKYYPDKAYIELYDLDGILQSTQTVTLTPDDSTQYF